MLREDALIAMTIGITAFMDLMLHSTLRCYTVS
jgi:hypothetical protein